MSLRKLKDGMACWAQQVLTTLRSVFMKWEKAKQHHSFEKIYQQVSVWRMHNYLGALSMKNAHPNSIRRNGRMNKEGLTGVLQLTAQPSPRIFERPESVLPSSLCIWIVWISFLSFFFFFPLFNYAWLVSHLQPCGSIESPWKVNYETFISRVAPKKNQAESG